MRGSIPGVISSFCLNAMFKNIILNFRASRIRATTAEAYCVSRRVLFSFHTLSYNKRRSAGHAIESLSYVGLKYSALCSNFDLVLWSSEAFIWPDNTMDLQVSSISIASINTISLKSAPLARYKELPCVYCLNAKFSPNMGPTETHHIPN